jgi:hypothetical protein
MKKHTIAVLIALSIMPASKAEKLIKKNQVNSKKKNTLYDVQEEACKTIANFDPNNPYCAEHLKYITNRFTSKKALKISLSKCKQNNEKNPAYIKSIGIREDFPHLNKKESSMLHNALKKLKHRMEQRGNYKDQSILKLLQKNLEHINYKSTPKIALYNTLKPYFTPTIFVIINYLLPSFTKYKLVFGCFLLATPISNYIIPHKTELPKIKIILHRLQATEALKKIIKKTEKAIQKQRPEKNDILKS